MTTTGDTLEKARLKLRHCAYKLANTDKASQNRSVAVQEHEDAALMFAAAAMAHGVKR